MELESDTRFLRDHFNANSVLMINHVIGHDMYIETWDLNEQLIGPAIRIFNWAGSGNTDSVKLYEYLLSLHQNYGASGFPHKQIDFKITDDSETSKEVIVRDSPTEPDYLRITTDRNYIGFQTYSDSSNSTLSGPLVRFDRNLVKIAEQTDALAKMIGSRAPTPTGMVA